VHLPFPPPKSLTRKTTVLTEGFASDLDRLKACAEHLLILAQYLCVKCNLFLFIHLPQLTTWRKRNRISKTQSEFHFQSHSQLSAPSIQSGPSCPSCIEQHLFLRYSIFCAVYLCLFINNIDLSPPTLLEQKSHVVCPTTTSYQVISAAQSSQPGVC